MISLHDVREAKRNFSLQAKALFPTINAIGIGYSNEIGYHLVVCSEQPIECPASYENIPIKFQVIGEVTLFEGEN